MIGRRAAVGLSLLSALLFCAFAAQSASAAKSVNTTAFTCVEKGGAKDFEDAHCDKKVSEGKFGHVAIANDTTTAIDVTNEKVTTETKEKENAKLNGSVPGGKVEIVCKKVKNDTTKSFIHNVETEKKHTLTGTARTEFSECEVKILTNCKVKEPIINEATFEGVEGLVGPKETEKNAMGIEFVGEGDASKLFASITFEGEKCALNGKTFPINGTAIATSGPTTESGQENKSGGATLVFTPKFKMQNLTLGGNPAEFTGIFTSTMAEKGNPISVTTFT